MSLERILNAESVAIIGASKNETKRGYQTIRTLLDEKYEGKIYPVHPKETSVLNLKAYPRIETGLLHAYEVANQKKAEGYRVLINCSWGGPGFSNSERDVIQNAYQKNVIIIAAAGNNDDPNKTYAPPETPPAPTAGAQRVILFLKSNTESLV